MTTLSDADFEAVRSYLVSEAGLIFDESRRAGLASILSDRMHSIGETEVPAYLNALRGTSGAAERQRLLDAVTVQETHFFRNPPQMEALRRRILPELIRRAAGRERPLTVWSAGCSTGEEPYTLAMLLLELSPMLAAPSRVRILGTDVSSLALGAAERATYSGRTLDAAPPMMRDRWFETENGSTYVVKDLARRLVELRLHNLVTDPPPFGPGEVDLIVCRNVTIYFGRDTTARLIGSFHDLLAEGGYLLLGHSETLWQVSDAFSLVPVGDAFVYRRSPADSAGQPVRPGGARVRRPGDSPVVRAARPSTAELPRPASARADSRRSADELLVEARDLLAAGEHAAAAGRAARAVAADPLLAEAYLVLGEARSTLGQDGAAIETLRKAVYLDPSSGHAHYLLAAALFRTGLHGAAAVSYRAAARAVEAMSAEQLAELPGRDQTELAHLCEQMADAAARAARTAGAASEAAREPGAVSATWGRS